MPSSFELFKQQIDGAVALIEQTDTLDLNDTNVPTSFEGLVDTQSLLARCEAVCKEYEDEKPTIRIIHHLACSGGSLISKCLSALPNVYLLSEVHPFTELALDKEKPKYSPTDLIALSHYAGVPQHKELAGQLFKQSIATIYEHVEKRGGVLVLRDHTHADYCTNVDIPEKSTLVSLLEDDYNVESILTIRDPIDSYNSLVKNGWVHFSPGDFDEYCRRVLVMLERFEPDQIFKYEEFVAQPQDITKKIVERLVLTFDDSFEDIFSCFKVTGDSGRSADVISKRDRVDNLSRDVVKSPHYKTISSILGID